MGTTWARHLEVTSHTLTRDNIYICRKKRTSPATCPFFCTDACLPALITIFPFIECGVLLAHGAASWLKRLFQANMRNSSCRHLLHNSLRCLLISAHCIPD